MKAIVLFMAGVVLGVIILMLTGCTLSNSLDKSNASLDKSLKKLEGVSRKLDCIIGVNSAIDTFLPQLQGKVTKAQVDQAFVVCYKMAEGI